MPNAYNPWREANQREGKVSIKQSQALSLILPCSFSSSYLSTRCLSFILLFIQSCFFLSPAAPVCIWSPMSLSCRVRDGASGGMALDEGRIPSTTGLVTDKPGPSSNPYSTRYSPGKHLLCSLDQKLASNIAHPTPNSCLVMPIKNLHKLWFKGWKRKKKVEEGHWERHKERRNRKWRDKGRLLGFYVQNK